MANGRKLDGLGEIGTGSRLVFPNLGRWTTSWSGSLPGTDNDYAALAGKLWLNPVVQIALRWIGDNFFEPTLTVTRGKGKGKGKPLPNHPLLDLATNPNPYYDAAGFWKACALSDSCYGDTYILKVRDGYGVPRELYWLYPQHVVPISDNGEFLSHYEYRPLWGSPVQTFDPADVVHVRNGLDPLDPRHGMSPLRAILREIVSDNCASTYTAALLQNMGAVPFIISPADNADTIEPETAAAIKKKLSENSGDGAGDPLVMSERVRINRIGSDPQQMALDTIRHFPEDRICAALGLNTIALGLTSGAGSKTYANYQQAVRAQYHGCLQPLLSRFADALNTQLLPELDAAPGLSVGFDFSGVDALREDQEALSIRVNSEWVGGLVTKNEARARLGYEPATDGTGDTYFSGGQQIPRLTPNAF